jgi:DNA-binding HxlR family transcriptional regulator
MITRVLKARNIKLLLYIHSNGGVISGFRETSKIIGMSYGILRDALNELEYAGLLRREVKGYPPIAKYFLTDKGMRIAELLKNIKKELEG